MESDWYFSVDKERIEEKRNAKREKESRNMTLQTGKVVCYGNNVSSSREGDQGYMQACCMIPLAIGGTYYCKVGL